MTLYRPPEFDEAMIEPLGPPKPPEPGSDAYFEAMSAEIDRQPIGVQHTSPRIGPTD